MSDEVIIGPNPCHYCGGEYGDHDDDCRRPRPAPARIIIGEGERAGLPISAPLIGQDAPMRGLTRWLKRNDGTFALQEYLRGWEDVPCIEEGGMK